jgi:hypothetical protein
MQIILHLVFKIPTNLKDKGFISHCNIKPSIFKVVLNLVTSKELHILFRTKRKKLWSCQKVNMP